MHKTPITVILASLMLILFQTVTSAQEATEEIDSNDQSLQTTYTVNANQIIQQLQSQISLLNERINNIESRVTNLNEITYTAILRADLRAEGATGQLSSHPKTSYNELVAILLTGVGVILAAVTLFIGVAAFFGWRSVKSSINEAARNASDKATEEAVTRVSEEIAAGTFNDVVTQAVDKIAFSNMLDPETESRE